jgi:leucyl/phenylalanyl-tRNA--protein transferase
MELAWIPPGAPPESFPALSEAMAEPNGLLAVGGDLSPGRLLHAYRHGIFPWYDDDQPILWWSPDPRTILWPSEMKVSRSLAKCLRQGMFSVRVNTAFESVMHGCAAPRAGSEGTWITPEMLTAYVTLHKAGYAHSVECWADDELVGGLYGVCIGQVFFGESMFSRRSDASKVALTALCDLGFALIDCQLPNAHLTSLGARPIARSDFVRHLDEYCQRTFPTLSKPQLTRLAT